VNLVLALALLGAGSVAVWAGIVDPEGGIGEGLRRALNSEPAVKRTSAAGAAFVSQALAVSSAAGGQVGGVSPTSYTGGDMAAGAPAGARAKVIQEAKTWLGVPYAWGGNTRAGVDCSGFTVACFKTVGVSLPRVSAAQALTGARITEAQAQAGDLVFFGLPVHHVGIFLGAGSMIHAPKPGGVVRIETLWRSEPIAFRNVLDSTKATTTKARKRKRKPGTVNA